MRRRGRSLIGSLEKAVPMSESALWITWEEDTVDKGKSENKSSEVRACLEHWRRARRAVWVGVEVWEVGALSSAMQYVARMLSPWPKNGRARVSTRSGQDAQVGNAWLWSWTSVGILVPLTPTLAVGPWTMCWTSVSTSAKCINFYLPGLVCRLETMCMKYLALCMVQRRSAITGSCYVSVNDCGEHMTRWILTTTPQCACAWCYEDSAVDAGRMCIWIGAAALLVRMGSCWSFTSVRPVCVHGMLCVCGRRHNMDLWRKWSWEAPRSTWLIADKM